MKRRLWWTYLIGFCLLTSVSVASYVLVQYFVFPKKPVNVFIEMKIIDQEGHPTAGANVFQGSRLIGVSDAFGEWSQVLKVNSGSILPLTIRKNTGRDIMEALKNITIPSMILIDDSPRIRVNVRLSKKWKGAKLRNKKRD
jgi:hypothetical protein